MTIKKTYRIVIFFFAAEYTMGGLATSAAKGDACVYLMICGAGELWILFCKGQRTCCKILPKNS